MSIENIFTFILVSSLLSLAPGPDNIFVLMHSALHGRKTGIFVTLGLCTGLAFHTTAVALGLAVIFQTSALAFNILKYLGVGYLLYLAWLSFKAELSDTHSPSDIGRSFRALYLRGVIMNITNPKVSIFFLAFLPQFINTENDDFTAQNFVFGLLFICVALIVFSTIANLAGLLSNWLNSKPGNLVFLNRFTGFVLLGLALKLLVSSAGAT